MVTSVFFNSESITINNNKKDYFYEHRRVHFHIHTFLNTVTNRQTDGKAKMFQ
jgi:hypothetical protein